MTWFNRSKRSSTPAAYLKPKWVDLASQWSAGDQAQINLDFKQLAARGFTTPDNLGQTPASDFSVVKRRLFRRLDYFNHLTPSTRPDGSSDQVSPVVLVTSAGAGEGKTFTSANLARSLAIEERRTVLLIDGDLADPSLPGLFGFDVNRKGLFELLANPETELSDVLLRTDRLPLAVLPAGQATTSPAALLGGQGMTALIEQVSKGREAFDFIVIDGPPLLQTTEAAVLAPFADEVILVAGAGMATVERLKASLELIGNDERVSLVVNRALFSERIDQYSQAS